MRWILALVVVSASPLHAAGFIENICMVKSGQSALCACTQSVANSTLSQADQRTAASMIAEPDLYYDYAESTRNSKQAFIDRYDIWGDKVAELCVLEG